MSRRTAAVTAAGLQGAQLDKLLGSSLRFEPMCGNVTHMTRPHTTGWRTLPGLVCAQLRRGRTVLRLGNGATCRIAGGQAMVLPAGVFHRVDLASPTGLSHWVHANYWILHSLDLFALLEVPPVVGRRLAGRLGDAIAEWVETEAKGGGSVFLHAQRNAFGYRLLALLSEVCRLKPEAERSLDGIASVQAVIEHINRNLGQPISRDALAEVAGLSRAQFHRVFTRATGCSPVRFLRNIRLRLAQQLLISTGEPVKAVAQRCGYEDVFVFSKAFKRDSGLSPSSYRLRTGELR
jgi:AraC-like DNA-binding protein